MMKAPPEYGSFPMGQSPTEDWWSGYSLKPAMRFMVVVE
jgi:hypothetical protein